MKKLLIISAIIISILCLNKQEKIVIPNEAIRFRVIANSNTQEDQSIKEKVVINLNKSIKRLEFTPKNINDSRQTIKKSIPEFSQAVEETLSELNVSNEYTINYGMNYFPEKEYKGIKYPEGEYESLVITLGDGLGDNFWCILFPPLCLLEGEETDSTEVEYTSFIKELLDKYF